MPQDDRHSLPALVRNPSSLSSKTIQVDELGRRRLPAEPRRPIPHERGEDAPAVQQPCSRAQEQTARGQPPESKPGGRSTRLLAPMFPKWTTRGHSPAVRKPRDPIQERRSPQHHQSRRCLRGSRWRTEEASVPHEQGTAVFTQNRKQRPRSGRCWQQEQLVRLTVCRSAAGAFGATAAVSNLPSSMLRWRQPA